MPEDSWQDMTRDFIINVPLSLGMDEKIYDVILVVVICYTKLAKYYSILKIITAEQLSNLLVPTVFCSFGVPSSIVSNWELFFRSTYWSASYCYLHIKQHLSTTFYLQIDG